MSTTAPEKHEFQADVKQLLDIVIHSLYTNKEIFVRELISNASDALEKLRRIKITEKNIFDENLELEINITTDDTANTLTIQDFGIGMSREELVQNLGTIAHSDSKRFLQALSEGSEQNLNLIGQFGVGFYSAFMVAKDVKVFSHSWKEDEPSHVWSSDGSGAFEIQAVDGQRRGTKVVLSLDKEQKKFCKADEIKRIIKEYSSFVQFPINVNGERVNTQDAIWLKNKSEIKEEDYNEFYKFACKAFDEPMLRLHFNADAPLAINALLYTPASNMEAMGFTRAESEVALYCRKVLIDAEPKGLFPEWLRFLKGVVDSEDLPLNISRETMQDSALIQKLNLVLTKRYLKQLEEEAKKRPETYETFWNTFGNFIKEGVTSDFTHKDKLTKLLRFESSLTDKGKLTSLADYVSGMKEEQKEIYYLQGTSRETIENGPYLEAFKARNLEVLFVYQPIDEFVMNHVREFEGKTLVSADQDEIELESVTQKDADEALPQDEADKLCGWLKETLGERVESVRASDRLIESPAMSSNSDKFMTTSMRRMMKQMNPDAPEMEAKVVMHINPRHELVKNLATLRDSNPDLAKTIAEQVFDNTLVEAGILEDPKKMIGRVYKLLEKLSLPG
ncbi:MAG: molecular chaperone HtpG [Verrucomicrobia bacterium]|nr:molecular chaperone HtpG [Verrucomicrobiota bacterium]